MSSAKCLFAAHKLCFFAHKTKTTNQPTLSSSDAFKIIDLTQHFVCAQASVIDEEKKMEKKLYAITKCGMGI